MIGHLESHEHLMATEEGYFASEKWHYLAQVMADLYENLELRWVPPRAREHGDGKPYVIVGKQRDGREYPVMYLEDSDEPEDVIGSLFMASMKHGNVMDRMKARNDAAKLLNAKKREEESEQRKDMVAFLMSNKNFKTMRNHKGDLVKFDDVLNSSPIRSSIL